MTAWIGKKSRALVVQDSQQARQSQGMLAILADIGEGNCLFERSGIEVSTYPTRYGPQVWSGGGCRFFKERLDLVDGSVKSVRCIQFGVRERVRIWTQIRCEDPTTGQTRLERYCPSSTERVHDQFAGPGKSLDQVSGDGTLEFADIG
jgi:hypothetical protein